eukprot:9656887-Karenia_brevis.AAC.1
MIRALAIPYEASDAVFFQRLRDFGFSDSEISEIFTEIQDPSFFDEVYSNPHMTALLKSLSSFSWLSSECLPGIIKPNCGTLAGTSLADLFFMASFLRVMKHFDEQCRGRGLGFEMPVSSDQVSDYFGFHIPDASFYNDAIGYVDDLFKAVFCHAAE